MKPGFSASAAALVKQRLASLRHLDLRQHSIDELVARVRELLEGQPLRCLTLAPGRLLYRGILCEALPERLADVSYPPAEAVRHDQRANRAGMPMFYCSATWHPPFFEAHVQPGDGIVISRWQTRQPLRILSFGYADTCADDPHSDREKALHYALAQLPAETRDLATFLTSTFTKTVDDDNRHHYRLSIAVAEACQLGQAFDGLLYPSAAMASPAHNLALHPSCLDAGKLTLDYVEHLRVHHVSPDTDVLDVRSLDIAPSAGPDGRLHWLGRPGNWVLREGSTATDCWLQNGEWWCA
ncbi:RES domain-containing protein [Siccationidurans ginsengisoli]|uniref:RES domain-containing protein n=1 Tax=Hymenobacter TaxID=89966 RepID=UPI001AACA395|nr:MULTISPECIES: RES domain-containing protein [unclassified Hymenobacter]MBO2030695.1 RES domain-containing protein [Hymenobacter sp. BT559]